MRGKLSLVLVLLAAIGSAACGHNAFGSRVDIQVEVTAASDSGTFSGTLESLDQDDIDFTGTTPFTAEFSNRRVPVDVTVRRLTSPGIVLTLCVTNLDSGRRRCRDTTSTSVHVEV